ncbi:MAG: hypothetical protein KC776_14135 [Myxococcales bacterium]|nr:hypothetical protein [Myxococcales bacterium]MCB9579778.1 hypothetical protein [Polyangiaceae bacterium]
MRVVAAALLALLSTGGCKCSKDKAPSVDAGLAPLAESSWLVPLDVPGFRPASVAVPLGAVTPRPIVIALHGSADRAEWQCGAWRSIVGPHPFVLCPAGVERRDLPGRSGWGTQERTAAELRKALTALKKKYGAHVAGGPVVLAGYGPGASRAIAIAKQEPSFFARLVLVNGGTRDWTAGNAAVFAHGKGKRVLFVCGMDACRHDVDRAVMFARHAGIVADAVSTETGAPLERPLIRAIRGRYAWLVGP